MIKPYKLDTNNHSAFRLHYHLILTIKYRRQIIDNQIEQDLINDFKRIAENYHITLDEAKAIKTALETGLPIEELFERDEVKE